jgi:hypothetical protein
MVDDGREHWEWRYSGWLGIMYGPIPVGWIALSIVLAVVMMP